MAAGQKNISLPADTYYRLREAAERAGESIAVYLTKAADDRRRKDEADAYAAYCAQPEIAEQISAFLGNTHLRMSAWRATVDAP